MKFIDFNLLFIVTKTNQIVLLPTSSFKPIVGQPEKIILLNEVEDFFLFENPANPLKPIRF